MHPYLEGVIAEKAALDERLAKLLAFISNHHAFTGLEPADRQLLRDQRTAMLEYSDILGKRIDRF